MTEFPVSVIHLDTPEMPFATTLFTAPIDLEAATARVGTPWNGNIASEWEEGGSTLRFALCDVVALLSPVPKEAVPERGRLPVHGSHAALTRFVPMQDVDGSGTGAGGFGSGTGNLRRESGGSGGESGDRAVEAGNLGIPGFTDEEIAELKGLPREIGLWRRVLTVHVTLTGVVDTLMREKSAIGLLRPELGVAQSPWMMVELTDLLSRGQAPIPPWVGIHVSKLDLVYSRMLGLPLFGHFGLEVVRPLHSEEEVYVTLSSAVDYLFSADASLLPGQNIRYRDGKGLAISRAVSPTDRATVLHIGF